jgi:NADH-quinone oxidoreductase subunit H
VISWADIGWMLVKIVVIFAALLLAMAYLTLVERRVVAWFQWRLGPNRVGPLGLIQPIADGVKLLFKQELVPSAADVAAYFLAPAVSLIAAFAVIAVIPIMPGVYIADINVALLLVLALSSLGIYGIILAGWSSGSKYPFLGALRSCAQMISYELALAFAAVGVVMLAGTFSLREIVEAQAKLWYAVPQILGLVVFLIAGFAEANRAPFDMPECESELVAGYHTEYSSMKFAMFFLGEYVAVINVGMLTAVLFLGGWQGPAIFGPMLLWLSGLMWFLIKTFAVIFLFLWVRATLPRFRYDQLMRFGWMVLLPLAILNILITAALKAFM